jgi:hypothetical protein
MLTTDDTRRRLLRRDLAWAGAGLLVAVVAGLALDAAFRRGWLAGTPAQPLVAYLATWIPLGVAVWAVCARSGWRRSVERLGLRFGVLDLFWGIAGGCIARLADAVIRLQLTGSTGLVPQPVLGTPHVDGWAVVVGIVAPVIVAPLIEELFFRGLLQRSLASAFGGARRLGAAAPAILITSVLFALAHVVVGETSGASAIATAAGTFAFSVIVGVIASATDRIGGAIVAHVVFNGVAVLVLWPW